MEKENPANGEVKLLNGMTLEEFAAIDDKVPTCAETEEDNLDIQSQPEEDPQKDGTDEIIEPVISFTAAAKSTQQLIHFALTYGFQGIPELLENFHGQIQTEHLKKKSRVAQTPLTSFFPKITEN